MKIAEIMSESKSVMVKLRHLVGDSILQFRLYGFWDT
jgi:hypothetical protein